MAVIINGTNGVATSGTNLTSTSLILNGGTSGAITLVANATAGTNTLTLPASTGTILSNTTAGVCAAWVNFDGTLTTPITPRASFNVTNITKVSTGVYTINFTNALADANYAATCSAAAASGGVTVIADTQTNGSGSIAPTASNVTIAIVNRSAGAFVDSPYVNVQVFR
jgi:hypothetical protein